ncbi:MAG: TadE/TadG family type IV pilus assembly protein [Xanthobacteraceae bacterium]
MFRALRGRLIRSTDWLRTSKHFSLCQKGTTAIEFALVAAPFLALLVALLETGLVFFAGRVLDEVTEEASRYVLTGQAQQSNMTQAQFENYICTSSNTATLVSALFNCSNLMVNVEDYSDFASASTSSPTLTFNADGTVSNAWNYSPGSPGSIVVVQVMYQWPIILGPLGFNLSNLSNGNRLLVSTAVFKNEPY